MAEVDARIPMSGVMPQIMNPAQLAQVKNQLYAQQLQQLQIQEATTEIEGKNVLARIMADPNNVGPDGQVKPAALAGLDPRVSMNVRNSLADLEKTRADAQRAAARGRADDEKVKSEQQERYAARLRPVAQGALDEYESLIARGVPLEEAIRQAQAHYSEQLDLIAKDGDLPNTVLEQARGIRFNPHFFRGKLATGKEGAGAGPTAELMRAKIARAEGRMSQAEYDAIEKKETKGGSTAASTAGKIMEDYKNGVYGPVGSPQAIKLRDDGIRKADAPPSYMFKAGQPSDFGGENGEILAALAERGVSLPAGFRSKGQQVALLNALRTRNPGLSPDQIAEKVRNGQIDLSNMKTEGRVAAGIAGRVAYAEQEIEQTIPLVREASANLPRGKFVPWNELVQMGQSKFSNPDLAEFRMYMTSLSNAYDMLAARGGTDKDKRAESRKQFDTAPSMEALERVMRAVQNEARASGIAADNSLKPRGSRSEASGSKKSYSHLWD